MPSHALSLCTYPRVAATIFTLVWCSWSEKCFCFFHPFLNNVWLAQECECVLFTYMEVSPGNLYSYKNSFYLAVFSSGFFQWWEVYADLLNNFTFICLKPPFQTSVGSTCSVVVFSVGFSFNRCANCQQVRLSWCCLTEVAKKPQTHSLFFSTQIRIGRNGFTISKKAKDPKG